MLDYQANLFCQFGCAKEQHLNSKTTWAGLFSRGKVTTGGNRVIITYVKKTPQILRNYSNNPSFAYFFSSFINYSRHPLYIDMTTDDSKIALWTPQWEKTLLWYFYCKLPGGLRHGSHTTLWINSSHLASRKKCQGNPSWNWHSPLDIISLYNFFAVHKK